MVYTLSFFPSKCSLFHKSNIFGSCIIHILYIGCAEIKNNNSGARRLKTLIAVHLVQILVVTVSLSLVGSRTPGIGHLD
jgi:hypothetical protein